MTEPKDLAGASDAALAHRLDNTTPMPRPGAPAVPVFESAGALLEATWRARGEPVRRMPTGLRRLDRFLGGGFTVPSLVLLGAGPKSAKSTIASAITENHVAAGGTAMVIDLENGARRWARRLLMRQVEVGEARLTQAVGEPVLDREEHERIETFPRVWGAEGACGRRLVRYPDALLGRLEPRAIADIFGAAVARRDGLAAEGLADPKAPALIVIDSVQKLPGSLEHRRDVVDGWIRAIEAARHAHPEAVALVISEFARKANGDGYVGFKESSGLEYTADLALGLEAIDNEDPPRDGPAPWPGRRLRLRALHNRDGDTGPAAIVHAVRPWHGIAETDEDPRDSAGAPSSAPSPSSSTRGKQGKRGKQASREVGVEYGEPWRS